MCRDAGVVIVTIPSVYLDQIQHYFISHAIISHAIHGTRCTSKSPREFYHPMKMLRGDGQSRPCPCIFLQRLICKCMNYSLSLQQRFLRTISLIFNLLSFCEYLEVALLASGTHAQPNTVILYHITRGIHCFPIADHVSFP